MHTGYNIHCCSINEIYTVQLLKNYENLEQFMSERMRKNPTALGKRKRAMEIGSSFVTMFTLANDDPRIQDPV